MKKDKHVFVLLGITNVSDGDSEIECICAFDAEPNEDERDRALAAYCRNKYGKGETPSDDDIEDDVACYLGVNDGRLWVEKTPFKHI